MLHIGTSGVNLDSFTYHIFVLFFKLTKFQTNISYLITIPPCLCLVLIFFHLIVFFFFCVMYFSFCSLPSLCHSLCDIIYLFRFFIYLLRSCKNLQTKAMKITLFWCSTSISKNINDTNFCNVLSKLLIIYFMFLVVQT